MGALGISVLLMQVTIVDIQIGSPETLAMKYVEMATIMVSKGSGTISTITSVMTVIRDQAMDVEINAELNEVGPVQVVILIKKMFALLSVETGRKFITSTVTMVIVRMVMGALQLVSKSLDSDAQVVVITGAILVLKYAEMGEMQGISIVTMATQSVEMDAVLLVNWKQGINALEVITLTQTPVESSVEMV